jgi:hypothetical protein
LTDYHRGIAAMIISQFAAATIPRPERTSGSQRVLIF